MDLCLFAKLAPAAGKLSPLKATYKGPTVAIRYQSPLAENDVSQSVPQALPTFVDAKISLRHLICQKQRFRRIQCVLRPTKLHQDVSKAD